MVSAIVIMSIGLFSLSAAVLTLGGAVKELKKDRDLVYGSYSFYTAESAAKEGLHQFLENPPYSGGETPLLNNSSESKVAIDCSENWPECKVIGTAQNNDYFREVVYLINTFPESLAFSYAVYSQADLLFNGTPIVNGDIYAVDEIEFNGTADINGDAYSPTSIGEKENIKGTAFSFYDTIDPPNINPYSYKDEAVTLTTAEEVTDYLEKPEEVNEVVFVEGPAKIHLENTTLNGCLLVMGDLTLNSANFTASDKHPAIYVGGDLNIKGNTIIEGVVYVEGETSINGVNTIEGSLISKGDVSFGGTDEATIGHNDDFTENWEDLIGLEPSSQDPIIIEWSEN